MKAYATRRAAHVDTRFDAHVSAANGRAWAYIIVGAFFALMMIWGLK